jgi:hypothetical protein
MSARPQPLLDSRHSLSAASECSDTTAADFQRVWKPPTWIGRALVHSVTDGWSFSNVVWRAVDGVVTSDHHVSIEGPPSEEKGH